MIKKLLAIKPESVTPEQIKSACEIVERECRAIGKDCQVIFTTHFVEVAPLSWAGSETAPTLFEAITQAKKSSNSA